ncbi:MAG: glutamyl-tRNA reductase [Thermoanaerobaculia bacterium]
MALVLVGLSHRTAPLEVRERLDVAGDDLARELHALRGIDGVTGAAVLSTCNRVEVVASIEDETAPTEIAAQLAARGGMTPDELERHIYVLRHRDVIAHAFRVASGLDSMIVGEPQIAGQVREAYRAALEQRTLDPVLHKLFEQTLRVAKKVRSETGIGELAVSVPYAAVELAKKIFGKLEGLRVLLVGAGKIGELTAENLKGQGLASIFVANRSADRARELAERFGGTAVDYDGFAGHLDACDIVVVSTAAPEYVIRAPEVATAIARRRRRDLFLIDLSVPRNLDPAIAAVEGAYLYDVDDLRGIAEANRDARLEKAGAAEAIIEHEVEAFLHRIASHEVIPTILELQQRLEAIREGELEKCLRKIGPITAEQREAIETLSSGIINKVLHYPILRLKESTAEPKADGSDTLRDTIRRIFGLR